MKSGKSPGLHVGGTRKKKLIGIGAEHDTPYKNLLAGL